MKKSGEFGDLGSGGHRWRPVAAMAVVMICSLFIAWPLPQLLVMGHQIALGHEVSDLADHLWGTWWWGGQILEGNWPNETRATHLPAGAELWHIDPVGAVVGLLLRPLGFPLAWNLMLGLQLMAAAMAATWWGHRWTQSWLAGMVSGVVVGSGAYIVGYLHSGLSEYVGLVWVVVGVALVAEAMGMAPGSGGTDGNGSVPSDGRHWAWPQGFAGIAVGLAAWQAPYYFVFLVIFVLCGLVPRRRIYWARSAMVVLLVGFVVASPAMWASLSSIGGAVSRETAPGWRQLALPATDLLSFGHPGSYYHPDTVRFGNPGILHVNYLGWVAIALAAWGMVKVEGNPGWRRLRLATLAYGIWMLGPVLCVGREVIRIGDFPLLLPASVFFVPGSPLTLIHHPYRMVSVGMVLMALFAARGVSRLPRWVGCLAPLAICLEVALVSPAPWPIATTRLDVPTVYEDIRDEGASVLDWPPDATLWNRRYLLWQVDHGLPVASGVNVFLDEPLRQNPIIRQLLLALEDPQRRARNRDVPAFAPILEVDQAVEPASLDSFSHIVVHRPALTRGEWQRANAVLNEHFGDPISADERAWAYEVTASSKLFIKTE